MTLDDHERPGPPSAPDATTGGHDHEPPLRWSAPTHRQHAGSALDHPRSVLLGQEWAYEPASCMTGVRVVALHVGNGTFVCPLCGLRTS